MHAPGLFLLVGTVLSLAPAASAVEMDSMHTSIHDLEGTWTLAYADVQHPDGTRAHDFGDAPCGRLIIDHAGRYALFIFNGARPRFAANDRSAGTPDEFRAAVLGTSSHFGTLDIDPVKGTLTFHIDASTYPNWEGTAQQRQYALKGDLLSYKVPARPNGDVPLTGWKRVSP
ncbi:lipocalin-like domain-containing protein [Dyella sp.]|uniref:lipocalin-like domain-containing protein n=1 Tax=Dyella sp. TaxID=1869338 RepID=UPI002ED41473